MSIVKLSIVAVAMMGCMAQGEPAPLARPVVGPPAADVERALATAWDPDMQATTRPRVEWFDNTACGMQRVVAAAELHEGPRCDDHWMDTTGVVRVAWHKGEKISATGLGLGLAEWKVWLWTSSLADHKLIGEERIAFDARIAGLGL
jgi:hypothetical protein